ncbi:unnamed protein product [Ambrosiozyma monospora]|uniref:Unnamed protein product n=1 Tax=Ambrosiozyma monospora TaxID=43982 RepID=A0ACB5T8W9_AMBMO|nr:unnamed protein product [Ambrosiozyma monospora]
MARSQGVKRRKKAKTSRMSTSDTYSWPRNKNDVELYSMISELPTELQIRVFSCLFLETHGAADIIKLIDPSWFKTTHVRTSQESVLKGLLKMWFQRTVIDYYCYPTV